MVFTAQQIADFLKGKVEGDKNVKVSEFAKIEEAKTGSITFLSNPKYTNFIYETKASVVLVNDDFVFDKKISVTLIRVPNAYESLAKLMQFYDKNKAKKSGKSKKSSVDKTAKIGKNCLIADFAYIAANATIGNNVKIYPGAYVGENVTVGDNTIIYPNVTIYSECKVGADCILHSGSVVGSDGFGFAPNGNKEYEKIPQIGIVILEDKVEIGANTTIDRATMGATTIHCGVKLDNMVQVAHNVEIGSHTVIASQTGISGSTKLGANMMVGGQVGFAGHITVADGVKVGAQSGLSNDIKEKDAILMGSPVMDMSVWRRAIVVNKNLPELQRTVSRLERELKELKSRLDQ